MSRQRLSLTLGEDLLLGKRLNQLLTGSRLPQLTRVRVTVQTFTGGLYSDTGRSQERYDPALANRHHPCSGLGHHLILTLNVTSGLKLLTLTLTLRVNPTPGSHSLFNALLDFAFKTALDSRTKLKRRQ